MCGPGGARHNPCREHPGDFLKYALGGAIKDPDYYRGPNVNLLEEKSTYVGKQYNLLALHWLVDNGDVHISNLSDTILLPPDDIPVWIPHASSRLPDSIFEWRAPSPCMTIPTQPTTTCCCYSNSTSSVVPTSHRTTEGLTSTITWRP
ncbi:hypothetical protein GCM10022630_28130 [Thermobifida alba]